MGRRVSRDRLIEAMWPDSVGAGTTSRLSVALSTLRAVLDPTTVGQVITMWAPTPTRSGLSPSMSRSTSTTSSTMPTGHWKASARGDAAAVGLLSDAVTSYEGDVFDGDNAVDWADPLREEARAVCGRMVRVLAADAERRGDTDAAAQCCLRLLAIDPFDEAVTSDWFGPQRPPVATVRRAASTPATSERWTTSASAQRPTRSLV